MTNISVTITLPEEIYEVWQQDRKRRGVIARLVAEHYGFTINRSRFVRNTTKKKAQSGKTLPHLAAPLIHQFRPKESA